MKHIKTVEELAAFLEVDFSLYEADREIEHAGIHLDRTVTQVAQAIRHGDPCAAIIGYKLIMADPHLPFGKLMKSDLARAFKLQVELLTEQEKLTLAGKTAELLSLEYCPREVEDYCKLVKKMGAQVEDIVISHSHPVNDKARSLVAYLRMPQRKEA